MGPDPTESSSVGSGNELERMIWGWDKSWLPSPGLALRNIDKKEPTQLKILVTGGAGYIGTTLCPTLLADGHEVTVLDSFLWGVKPILHFSTHPKLRIVGKDIRETGVLAEEIPQHDAVIHLAAIVGYPACARDENLAQSTNVDATRELCRLVTPSQVLLFASTGSTYGQVEDGLATEETPINPLTLYGRTKRDCEPLVREKGGVCLRFATVFGVSPRLRLDLLVNDFCYQAYHNKVIIVFEGSHRRTFLHVRDAAAAYPFALDNIEQMRGEVYNVGSPELNFTKIDVARAIRERADYYLHEADIGEDADKRNYAVCYRKIGKLGYCAEVSLQQGIDELLRVVPYITVRNEWRNA